MIPMRLFSGPDIFYKNLGMSKRLKREGQNISATSFVTLSRFKGKERRYTLSIVSGFSSE